MEEYMNPDEEYGSSDDGEPPQNRWYSYLVRDNNLEAIKQMFNEPEKINHWELTCAFIKAAKLGRIELVQFMYDKNLCYHTIQEGLREASEHSHVDIVQWLEQPEQQKVLNTQYEKYQNNRRLLDELYNIRI